MLAPDYYASTTWPLAVSARATAVEVDFSGGSYGHATSMPSSVGGVLSERVTLTPSTTGDYELELSARPPMKTLARASTTVHVVDPAASPSFKALLVGDSLTFAQNYPSQVQTRIAGSGTLVGTQGLESAPHEGRGGWHWQRYSIAGSPFYDGGGLDISGYLTTLGDTPDIVVWALFTNRVRLATDEEYQSVEDSEFAYAEAMLAAWPQSHHAIVMPLPGNADDNAWSTPTRETWRTRNTAIKRRILTTFGDREAEGIFVVPAETSVDASTAYNDNVHPDNDYESMGDSVAAFLHWYAQR